MPTSDPYFSSQSFEVFRAWSDAIRARLLNMNKYTPDNGSDTIAKEQHAQVIAVKKISNKSILQNEAISISNELDFKKLQAENETKADNVINYNTSVSQQAVLDYQNNLAAIQKSIPNTILSNYKDLVSKLVVDNKDSRQPNENEQKDFPDYLNYNVINNQAPVFPNTGVDVTTAITTAIMTTGEYKFFSNNAAKIEYKNPVKFPGQTLPNDNSIDSLSNAVTDTTKFIGSQAAPMSEYSKKVLQTTNIISPTGTYKFFIEKLHGRYYENGDAIPYNLNPVVDNQPKQFEAGGLNFSNRKVFAAFIDNYSDDYKVGWTPYSFIGRGENVYAYSQTERSITLDFTILTDHALEQMSALDKINEKLKTGSSEDILSFLLNQNKIDWGKGTYHNDSEARLNGGVSTYFDTPETTWQKLTFIAQCCYPYYRTDGKMKEQPLVRLRIADFYDVICMFNSVNIQLNPFQVPYIDFSTSSLGEQPVGFKITLSANIIHDYEPSSQFYGFYHRKQFDGKDSDASYKAKVWGIGLSKDADTLSKVLTKQSPLGIKDTLNMKNLNDLLSSTDFMEIQNDIKIFQDNFKGLEDKSVSLFEQVRKIKLKNIFDAIKSIKSQEDFFSSLSQISSELTPALTEAAGLYGNVANSKLQVSDAVRNLKNQVDTFVPSDITTHIVDDLRKKLSTPQAPKTFGDIQDGKVQPQKKDDILATSKNDGQSNNDNFNNTA